MFRGGGVEPEGAGLSVQRVGHGAERDGVIAVVNFEEYDNRSRFGSRRPRAYSRGHVLARHITCPACGAHHTLAIVYSAPDSVLLASAGRREIVLGGGGTAHVETPDRQCRDCGHQWAMAPQS
jgi:hypothetical protein